MATIILFAPLVGALICGFGWRLLGEKAGQVITTALVFLAAILSWMLFLNLGPKLSTSPSCAGSKAARCRPNGRSVWIV